MNPRGSILLVDDEAKIRTLLTKVLTEEGHEVVATECGGTARALLGERMFDLLIVDNLMPEHDRPRSDPRLVPRRSKPSARRC